MTSICSRGGFTARTTIFEDFRDIGKNTFQLIGAMLDIVPEIGDKLKDGSLTENEQDIIQSKVDHITKILKELKYSFHEIRL